MKKALIGLAVAAAMGSSAQAAEVYSLDGVTINLTGEVETQYIKTQSEAQDAQLDIAEANFGFDLSYEMTEDFAVGAHVDFDANSDEDGDDVDDVTRGDVYTSLVFQQAHTLTFGAQTTIMDDAGIGDDYEFGFTSMVDDVDFSGEQVIKYQYDGGEMFYGGVAYSAYENTTQSDESDSDYVLDGNFGVRAGDVEVTVYALTGEQNELDRDAYAFEARYFIGDFSFAGTYATSEEEQSSGSDLDIDTYGAAVVWWDGGRLEYAAGWANVDNSSADEDVNDIYANVTYSFTDEVSAYAEVGITDEDDTDTGYVVGINASF